MTSVIVSVTGFGFVNTLEQSKEAKFAQTGDLIYFTHPTGGIFKISRTGVDTFVGELLEPVNGPFQDENPDPNIELTLTGTTLTSSVDVFDPDDVGALVKLGYIPSTEFDAWEPSDGSYNPTDYLQYEERIYIVSSGTGATGKRPPLHEKGTKSDGNLELTYVSNGYGYVRIISYTSPTEVEVETVKDLPPNLEAVATD